MEKYKTLGDLPSLVSLKKQILTGKEEKEEKKLNTRLKLNKLHKRLEKWGNAQPHPFNHQKQAMKQINDWYTKLCKDELLTQNELIRANIFYRRYKLKTND
jgi:hypothetical protein